MSKTIDSDGDKRRAEYWVHKAAKLKLRNWIREQRRKIASLRGY